MFSDTQVSLTSNRVGRISLLNLEVPLFCWHRTFLEVGGVLADSFTFGRLSESDDYRSSPWKILFKTQYNFLGIFYRPIKRQKNICLFPNHQMFINIFWSLPHCVQVKFADATKRPMTTLRPSILSLALQRFFGHFSTASSTFRVFQHFRQQQQCGDKMSASSPQNWSLLASLFVLKCHSWLELVILELLPTLPPLNRILCLVKINENQMIIYILNLFQWSHTSVVAHSSSKLSAFVWSWLQGLY